VATYNEFERRFAEFLDNKAADVLRFAALGTTEQGESGTQFRVDYLKPSGAIGFNPTGSSCRRRRQERLTG
jgi:type III restriction enzyme